MNFLLRAEVSHDLVKAPNVAWVYISKSEQQQLLLRRKMFQALKGYDSELTTLEFSDQIEWLALHEDDWELEELVYNEHVLVNQGAPQRCDVIRVDCQFMQLDDSGVYWECTLKNTEVRCISTVLHWDLLEGKK